MTGNFVRRQRRASWWDRNKSSYLSLYGEPSTGKDAGTYQYTGTRDAYSAQNSNIYRWIIGRSASIGTIEVKVAQYLCSSESALGFLEYTYEDRAKLGAEYAADHSSLAALTSQVQNLVGRGPAGLTVNMGDGVGHAITCWGYTLNGEGLLESLMVTDSNYCITGLAQLFVSQEKEDGYFKFTGSEAVKTEGAFAKFKGIRDHGGVETTFPKEYSSSYGGASLLQLYSMHNLPSLPIPEPASSVLLLLGTGFGVWRRRR